LATSQTEIWLRATPEAIALSLSVLEMLLDLRGDPRLDLGERAGLLRDLLDVDDVIEAVGLVQRDEVAVLRSVLVRAVRETAGSERLLGELRCGLATAAALA